MSATTKAEAEVEQAAIEQARIDDMVTLEAEMDKLINWMRNIRQSEAVGVKARRIAIAITQLEQAHAYWLSYVVQGEDRSA